MSFEFGDDGFVRVGEGLQSHLRGVGASTEDDHGRAFPQTAVVSDIQLLAGDVAIGDGYDPAW